MQMSHIVGQMCRLSALTGVCVCFRLCRLLHLAVIHEAKDYIRTIIDQSKNTKFLDTQNDLRQVRTFL